MDVSPRRRIGLWLLIGAVLAAACSQADLAGNLGGLLPRGDDRLGRELRFFAGAGASQLFVLEAWVDGDGDPGRAAEVLRDAGRRLAPVGATPLDGAGPGALIALEKALYDHLPVLLPSERLPEVATRLSSDGLRDWLATVRERAARPEDTLTASLAREDLLALGGLVLEPLRDHLPTMAARDGVLVHEDGKHHLLLLEAQFPPDDSDQTSTLMAAVDTLVAEAAIHGVRVEAIGSHRHFRDNLLGLRSDLLASLPAGILLIAVVLATLVRRPGALVALHLPAVLAAMAAIATLALLGRPVPLLLIGFAAGFLGVSVENALHMTTALQAGTSDSVRRPLLISYLTTAVAFAVLVTSRIPALASLGLMVMGGLIAALASSLHLLPALIRRRVGPPTWRRSTAVVLATTRLPARTRAILAALISLILLPGLWRISVISDLRKMDGSRPETWTALEAFLGRWGHLESSDFLCAEADQRDEALATAVRARKALDLPPSPIEILVPDQAEQARRQAAWNAFWETEAAPFATTLASQVSPRAAAAFAPSLARYRPIDTVDTVTSETWTGTPFGPLVAGLVTRTDSGWRVAAPLPDDGDLHGTPGALAEDLQQRLDRAGTTDAWIASRAHLARDLVDVVRTDLGRLGLWMGLAMILLVALIERRLRTVLAIILPPALALAWTFGVLGWLAVPLTPFSVMVAAFVAGIGLDNAVFLARPEHRAQAIAPVLACTITTILGVGSLVVADNPLLRGTGISLSIGMVACLVACVLVTPLILPEERGRSSP